MAFLLVKRVWNDELVELLSARMSMRLARALLSNLRNSDDTKEDTEHGDMWFEVANEQHELVLDPVNFSFEDGKRHAFQMWNGRHAIASVFTNQFAEAQAAELREAVREVLRR